MDNTSIFSDFIDCPQCGMPAQKDTYYVAGEERVLCSYCGYTHLQDGEVVQVSKGYGSAHYVKILEAEDGFTQEEKIIRFNIPLDLHAKEQMLYKMHTEYNKDLSSLFVWNDDKGLEVLHGTTPKTLDEMYEEESEKFFAQRCYSDFCCFDDDTSVMC